MLPLTTAAVRSRSAFLITTRPVSSKYIRPHPRSYKRRLFEAAVAPVLPKEPSTCSFENYLARANREAQEYADIELAEVKEIRRWINEHGFRSMIVCQLLSVKASTLWLTKNQLRLAGLETREIDSKIGRKLFQNTAFDILEPLWVAQNILLFGKDVQSLKTAVTETNKYNYLIPLVFTFDQRVLSVPEVQELAKLPDLELVRAQTAQLLDQVPVQLTQALGHHATELSAILSNIEAVGGDSQQ